MGGAKTILEKKVSKDSIAALKGSAQLPLGAVLVWEKGKTFEKPWRGHFSMIIHELEMAKGEELKKKTHCAVSLKKIPACRTWRTEMFLLLSDNSGEWTSVRCFYFFQNWAFVHCWWPVYADHLCNTVWLWTLYLIYIYVYVYVGVYLLLAMYYPNDLKYQIEKHYTAPIASPVLMLPEGIKILTWSTYSTFLTSCTAILINISLCIVSSRHFNFPKCIELFHLIICINVFKIMLVNALLHFNLLIRQF